MLKFNELKTRRPIEDVCMRLQEHTDNFGVFFDLDRINEIMAILSLDNSKIKKKIFKIMYTRYIDLDDTHSVVQMFTQLGVPPHLLVTKDGGNAINGKVREAILRIPDISEDCKTVVQLYSTYSTNKYNISVMRTYSRLPECVAFDFRGHRMVRGNPIWNVLATKRIASANPNIQGIAREHSDIVTQPVGYILLATDSSQIEPRINFSFYIRDDLILMMMKAYGDSYYALLHYCVATDEDLARWRNDFSTFTPNEITDAMKAGRQQLKTLVNAGSYGSANLAGINPSLSDAFERRILNHPARLARVKTVTKDVYAGAKTFTTAFGTIIQPEAKDKYKTEDAARNHLVRCGVNNPVQGTAADLMKESIETSLDIVDNSKGSHVAYSQHDKLVFYIALEDMDTDVSKQLETITAYQVLDWAFIDAEFEYGVHEPSTVSYLVDETVK